jgi:hypothetical protein
MRAMRATAVSDWRVVDRHEARRAGVRESELRPLLDPTGTASMRRHELWVIEELTAEWRAAYRMAIKAGVPVVAELRIFPAETKRLPAGTWSGEWIGHQGLESAVPDGGLRSTILRRARVGRAPTAAMKENAANAKRRIHARDPLVTHFYLDEVEEPRPEEPTRGRRPHPERRVARTAVLYAEALRKGHRPVYGHIRRALVADGLLVPGASTGVVRRLVERARGKGFLTKSDGSGRVGGRLTPAGRAAAGRGRRD